MKKYIILILTLLVVLACSDDKYEDYNTDPKNPNKVSADFIFTSSIKNLGDQMSSPNVNLNIFRFISQYLTATTYLDEPNYNLTQRNIPTNHWTELYQNVLYNLKDAKENVRNDLVISEDVLSAEEKDARIAQIEVLEVYTWQVLVDTFGNIPYTEALKGGENTLPAYDDAATIYEDLINRLMLINEDFMSGQGFQSADVIYEGDMAKWQRFSNSIILRLGMRIADSNPTLSQDAVSFALNNGGVLNGNNENALIYYQGFPPNTNPLWVELVQSGRSDYVTANTIVDYMTALNDPRITTYFDDNLTDDNENVIYEGGVYGGSNSFSQYTHIGDEFREPAHNGILYDYAEVEFHLAEAAQRGYTGAGNAESHYNNAITASIKYWGGNDEDAADYLTQPEVIYNPVQWKEQIGKEFWTAMYDNPFQGWCVWRKFNSPELNLPEQTQLPVPLRYTYPIEEQNLNESNYNEAASSIGGDAQQTPIFWDVN